jgi:hypothetical protein
MTVSDVVQTEATNALGVLPEPAPDERIVPVWLSLDDLDLVDNVLRHFAATHVGSADLLGHVAELQKHLAWVRNEFTTSGAAT